MKTPKTKLTATETKLKQSIAEVFDQEESALLRYAYGYTKRREVAEEIVQEAFLKLHQHWSDVDQPRPWLYKAVRNIALNAIRKSKRESLTGEDDSLESEELAEQPDMQIRRIEAVAAMRLLMDKLSAKDRELVKLKFEEEMSYSLISEKLEIGVGNVGYRLHHVLKTLAEGLKRRGVDGTL